VVKTRDAFAAIRATSRVLGKESEAFVHCAGRIGQNPIAPKSHSKNTAQAWLCAVARRGPDRAPLGIHILEKGHAFICARMGKNAAVFGVFTLRLCRKKGGQS
jgi:hypothetical protein